MQFTKPLFITFEGCDGTGKTTQIELFFNWLTSKNIPSIKTREPGGTVLGEEIRAILLTGDTNKLTSLEELTLFSAARYIFVREIVWPALNNEQTVVSDRFADTTTVYQGYNGSIPQEKLKQTYEASFANRWPDITFVLDIPFEVGLSRKFDETGLQELRMENKGDEFHKNARKGFLKIAEDNPDRCIVINASGRIEDVQKQIQKAFLQKAKERGFLTCS